MRGRTLRHAKTVEEILNGITSDTACNDRAIAGLAILVALNAVSSVDIRVLSKWAIRSADGLSHQHVMISNRVGILLRGLSWAFGIALTHKEFVA